MSNNAGDPFELVALVDRELTGIGVEYYIVGSIASMYYGEMRLTQDVDLVVSMRYGHIAKAVALFPEEAYYVSEDAVREAVRTGGQFNVVNLESSLKLDVMVSAGGAFDESRFRRRRRVSLAADCEAWVASAEDVILKKLEYFREGGSQKHVRDIRGIITTGREPLDEEYIERWADRLSVRREWEHVRAIRDGA